MSSYEVRCHSCNVAFPPGTRRCMYCGGRTGAQPVEGDEITFRELIARSSRPEEAAPEAPPAELRGAALDQVDEETAPRRGLPTLIGNLVWVALLIAVSLYRACSD